MEKRISTKEKITLKVFNKGIKATISYPPHTRLRTRLKVLEELKEELYK